MKARFRASVRSLGFNIIFVLNNFVLISFCMAAAAIVAKIMMKRGLIPDNFYLMPLTLLNFAFLLGSIVSVITALISSQLSRRYLQVPLKAMKRLARGEFQTKMDFGYLPIPKEYDELALAFNDMASELSGIEVMRSDFINNFSHEFKTPIVSLRGFAKLLQKPGLTEQQRIEYTDIIISEIERLSQLSSNILDLTKIEKQTILTNKERYNLSEQIRQILLLLEHKWSAKNLKLELHLDEIQYLGNEHLLAQVWTNLLDNAIKFSRQDSKLRVFSFKDDNSIVVKIQDFGVGMDDGTLKYIFDKFFQGDESHTVEGNGLGLTIVKGIVELHKGTIQVESAINRGTIFTVILPEKTLNE